jgi:hypothetical protein
MRFAKVARKGRDNLVKILAHEIFLPFYIINQDVLDISRECFHVVPAVIASILKGITIWPHSSGVGLLFAAGCQDHSP